MAQVLLLANIMTASNGHENSNQASFCNLALQQHPSDEVIAKYAITTEAS
jgi:hypothetical protein